MSDDAIFASRYDVLGPPNGCSGDCEGTGVIPHAEYLNPPRPGEARTIDNDNDPPIYRAMWLILESRQPNADGDCYHFIPCPMCRPDHPLVAEAQELMKR